MRICVIDDQYERPAPPFLQEAFEELGHTVTTVYRSGLPDRKLEWELAASQADLFVAIHNVGFLAASVLTLPRFSAVRKAILFYDDPMSTYLLFGRRHPLAGCAGEHQVHFFIWDGYWRKQMAAVAGWESRATHLAAETRRFSPDKPEAIPAIRHCAVFLGNIPSRKSMEALVELLPPPYRKAAGEVERRIAEGTYGANPFELLDETLRQMPSTDREPIAQQVETYLNREPDLNQPLAPHIQLRRVVWQLAKRETRLRALRAAAQVVPLAILSNLKIGDVAGQDELVRELGGSKKHDRLFVDTSGASYYQLAQLYRSGRFHIQTTDPQSVEGGIPYRVFQCAACGVPLVSDYKKELAECFLADHEILLYANEAELVEVLDKVAAKPHDLKAIGMAGLERFRREHTWTHRAKAIMEGVGLRDANEEARPKNDPRGAVVVGADNLMRDVTIVMPTYGRPDLAAYMIARIAHRPLIIVVDADRREVDLPKDLPPDILVVSSEPHCGPVRAAETGFMAVDTRLIVNLNDDMEFTAESSGWLEAAIQVYRERIGLNRDGVVAIREGVQNGKIAPFALFTRKFYMDHLYPSPYRYYFVDTEMSIKAKTLGVYAYAPKAFIKHLNLPQTNQEVMRREFPIYEKRLAEFRP